MEYAVIILRIAYKIARMSYCGYANNQEEEEKNEKERGGKPRMEKKKEKM